MKTTARGSSENLDGTNRAGAIDGRTTRHSGCAVSQQKRKRVEEVIGWLQTVGLLRKVKLRGVRRVSWLFTFAATVYNLVCMRNLVEAATSIPCRSGTLPGHDLHEKRRSSTSSLNQGLIGRMQTTFFHSLLEQRVNEGRDRGSLGQHNQCAKQEKNQENRQQPELFPLFHKSPQLCQEFTHTCSFN